MNGKLSTEAGGPAGPISLLSYDDWKKRAGAAASAAGDAMAARVKTACGMLSPLKEVR